MGIEIQKIYTMLCDKCYKSKDFAPFQYGFSKMAFRLLALHEGWKIKDNKTYCPDCKDGYNNYSQE